MSYYSENIHSENILSYLNYYFERGLNTRTTGVLAGYNSHESVFGNPSASRLSNFIFHPSSISSTINHSVSWDNFHSRWRNSIKRRFPRRSASFASTPLRTPQRTTNQVAWLLPNVCMPVAYSGFAFVGTFSPMFRFNAHLNRVGNRSRNSW